MVSTKFKTLHLVMSQRTTNIGKKVTKVFPVHARKVYKEVEV
jgi:hypothetical protein